MIKIYSKLNVETPGPGDGPGGGKKLTGYAYKWGDKGFADGATETIEPGAFSKTLKEGKEVFFYNNHNPETPLGVTGKNMELQEDDVGLKFTIDLPDTQPARDAYELVNKQIMQGVSVGAVDAVADTDADGVRHIREMDLQEISLTQAPVYSGTEVMARHKTSIYPPEIS